jgi:acyl-coenzyme A synthetase/AMP-(fatty) acid ligase
MQFGAQECVRHWGKFRRRAPAIYTEQEAISYGDLDRRVNLVCQSLQSLGVTGNRVGILAGSKVACLLSFLAANRSGNSAVTLHLGLEAKTLCECINDTAPSVFVVDADGRAELERGVPAVQRIIDLESVLGQSREETVETIAENEPSEECCVLFSSGTTDRSKGIERDHYSMVTESIGWCLELGLTSKSTFYVGRPMYYTGGLVLALATLTAGGALSVKDSLDDNDFEEAWEAWQRLAAVADLEWAFFIPDQLRFFLRKIRVDGPKEPLAKRVLTMGAPITGNEKIAVSNAFGCDVIESWGNSESLGTITDAEDLATRPKSIGRPFVTDELHIVSEEGKELPPFELGRIAGGVEAGFTKYSNREDATNATKVGERIISDDIGYTDGEGYFYVIGRTSDLLRIDGKLLTVPAIAEVVREVLGETTFGVVVLSSDDEEPRLGLLTEGETIDAAEQARKIVQARFKVDIHWLHLQVRSLPRLPTGKLDRVRAAGMFVGLG